MTAIVSKMLFAAALLTRAQVANADGFLQGNKYAADSIAREAEFQHAMESLMGCGCNAVEAEARTVKLQKIEAAIATSWRALPKNSKGNVEWRMLRYVAHRYFMQQSSLFIRGFEPTRQVNESALGSAEILNKQPLLIEKLIASRQATDGFKLEDAVSMIATLEEVIFDGESSLLETVYKQQGKSVEQSISHLEADALIESYMVHWMLGSDKQAISILLKKKELLPQALPHWEDVKRFASGVLRTMEFEQQRNPSLGHARAAFAEGYNFDDVHKAVASITNTFASFWETECQTIKQDLISLDKTGTGRIPLSEFYGANADGNWRFGESEAYLRELGALDESSAWRGKQVIITNYLQGASNCIVTNPHYLVCCVNECESVLDDIEDAVGGPMATPAEVLGLVSSMTNFDDDKPKIDKALQNQLQRVAEAHGGQIPLHGRLFAQWLHYVFPRECPFPHRAGSFTSLTPAEYGEGYYAETEEVETHAAKRGETDVSEAKHMAVEQEWMTQWNEEEELHADYDLHMRSPWEGGLKLSGGVVVLALVGLFLFSGRSRVSTTKQAMPYSYEAKAHFV